MTVLETIRKYSLQGMKARFFNLYGNELEYNLDNCMSFADMEVKSIYIHFPTNTVDFTVKYFDTEVK